jgi:hypothetical protein
MQYLLSSITIEADSKRLFDFNSIFLTNMVERLYIIYDD